MLTREMEDPANSIGLYGTIGLNEEVDYRPNLSKQLDSAGLNLRLVDTRFAPGESWTYENWLEQERRKEELGSLIFYIGFCGDNPTVNLPIETYMRLIASIEQKRSVQVYFNPEGYESKRDLKIFDAAKRLFKLNYPEVPVLEEQWSAVTTGEVIVIEKPEPFHKVSGYSILEALVAAQKNQEKVCVILDIESFSDLDIQRKLRFFFLRFSAFFPEVNVLYSLEEAVENAKVMNSFNKN